jgi:hypothetical protein
MTVSLCKTNTSINGLRILLKLVISPLNLIYTYAHGVI